ncbi:hypothetical protein DFA_08748 [Cavenderia fasciculata]|uniref:Uncharacterized protein n=1 Tax=Cavenderia fasciculata TaxID=261658 RepID=F4Q447_CACFS|nr:uncharacterized protein DFA_08748 [Cavenderia fasciculata]EGG17749.1 hypothetical protein DFA_08748 [Cavenderia fasciculata]|eukprot:XP_004356233.1 hypothetical protein DFA_08748 [Cavenderia fasciculata]
MTVINIGSGEVNSTNIPIKNKHPQILGLERFLGVDANDNFLILVDSPTNAYGIITISQSGQILDGPEFVGPIRESIEWIDSSLQYDTARDSVYYVVTGPKLFVYDFAKKSTNVIKIDMEDRFSIPSGCFDGVGTYYIFENSDYYHKVFEMTSYSVSDNQQSENANVTGISPSSNTYLFCANKQVYTLAFDVNQRSNMTLYLLDTDNFTASISYNQDIGLPNSLNLWFIDNYFVFLSDNDNNQFHLTTVDLNTNQVVSQSQVQGTFNLYSQASGVF